MVRFKCGEDVAIVATFPARSQFHYGSIQMSYKLVTSKLSGHVSIPLWFDSNSVHEFRPLTEKHESQFHYGSIQMQSNSMSLLMVEKVSIPLWFDSNALHLL